MTPTMRGERADRWVAVFYVLYTVANLYPYTHPGRVGRILPQPGDSLWELWQIKWFARQVVRDPFHLWDVPAFYPLPRAMTFNDSLLGLALLGAPLGAGTGQWVLTRNVLMVLGFLLSAWYTYRLARALGAEPWGAALGGLLYGFCTTRFAHHITNLKLAFGPLIPLVLYALTRWGQTGRPLYLLGAFGAWALQMISSMYYGFFLLTLAPLYGLGVWVVYRERRRSGPRPSPGSIIVTVAGLSLGGAVLTLGFFVPYWETSFLYGLERTLAETGVTATLRSYVASGSVVGQALRRAWHLPSDRFLAWPGGAALGALAMPPWRDGIAALLWLLAGLSFLFSLGSRTPLFTGAFDVLPYFRMMRYPDRWGILVVFFLSLLAARGFSRFQRRLKLGARTAVGTVVLAFTAVELWHAPLTSGPIPEPPPIYRRLAAHSEAGAVAVFPLYSDFWEGSKLYGYWTTFHWKPVIGAVAAWSPPSFEWVRTVLADFPMPHALWLAADLGIRYFVFHPAVFRAVGRADEWEWYRQALRGLPPAWVRSYEQELEDVLIVLDVERIRRDMAIEPPRRFRWSVPAPDQWQSPEAPADRQALSDGDPTTAWVVPYTEAWHLRWDGGVSRRIRAVRIVGDPKDKTFFLWGSTDGQTWRPIPTVPWWVWAGARQLPEARTYPDPGNWRGKHVLLCAPNQTRYLKITATPVAGHIAVAEVQFVLEEP